MLILTNMFILFYFLFPEVSFFLTSLFGKQSYLLIILYNVFIAYLFLAMSGYKNLFLGLNGSYARTEMDKSGAVKDTFVFIPRIGVKNKVNTFINNY